jgi:hypothetical protein
MVSYNYVLSWAVAVNCIGIVWQVNKGFIQVTVVPARGETRHLPLPYIFGNKSKFKTTKCTSNKYWLIIHV